jgi:hypothetical protein
MMKTNNELPDEEESKDDDFFNVNRINTASVDKGKKKIFTASDWHNSVIVLVSVRLGLKKVQKEYFNAVYSFFNQSFNAGIIGGRPKEAYYLVGI